MAAAPTIKNYIRGDSRILNVQIYQPDGTTPLDLTNCEIFFTVSPLDSPVDDTDAAIKLDSTTDPTQVIVSNPPTGAVAIKVKNTNTQNLTPGTYYYDVQVKDSFGDVSSLPAGKFIVVADISRRIL